MATDMRVIPIGSVSNAIAHLRAGVSSVQAIAGYTRPQTSVLIDYLKPRLDRILETIEEYDIYQLQIHLPKAFDLLDECQTYLASRVTYD